jgi:hypothetical protein
LAENFEIIFFAKTNFLLKRRLVDFGIDTSTFFIHIVELLRENFEINVLAVENLAFGKGF